MYLRALAMIFFFFYSHAQAMTILPPPAVTDLQGQWLGGSEENREEYFRLDVNRSGQGLLIFQYAPDERPAVYKVLSAQLSEYNIEFQLQPINGAEPIYLRGTSYGSGLQMQVGNTEHRWRRKVLLEREHEVLSRISAVTARAAEFTASGQ
jgi:hypothetical protein